jgi:hypothetical protein
MTALIHARANDGRPIARAATPQDRPLARFLTEEVTSPDYALMLAAQTEGHATGDAYAVIFEAETALLEHLYLPDQPVARVPRARFSAALRAWAGFLRDG